MSKIEKAKDLIITELGIQNDKRILTIISGLKNTIILQLLYEI
ncbi:hypothetical protein [Clostridium estertheticum]|nr:hypothetical protein [Clostridium estertheticum]